VRIKRIFVAGSGLMGAGIAQVCAQAGYSVTLMDIKDEMLEKGMKAIKWSVSKIQREC
jgi:3-hydroxyacyl-CoA dehydrogenase